MGRKNGGYVRVEVWSCSVIVEGEIGFGEADEGVAVEGAEDLSAGVMGDDESGGGFGFKVVVRPDFSGDLDAEFEVGDGVEKANIDIRHVFRNFRLAVFGGVGRGSRYPVVGSRNDRDLHG
jgi:hypothetical protein